MNLNWVIGEHIVLDPTIDVGRLQNVGSMWGSWKTYRTCPTDNTICYEAEKSRELVKNKFHTMTNLYVHGETFRDVTLPPTIRVFGGNFGHEVENKDEIVCIHLCSGLADIVLLYGFDWRTESLGRLSPHYRGLTLQAIKDNPNTQYLLVDHPGELDPEYAILDNLTTDTLANVLAISA